MSEPREPDEREIEPDAGLRARVRHGQTDLDEAIALLRELDLDELPPAAAFDPNWPEEDR